MKPWLGLAATAGALTAFAFYAKKAAAERATQTASCFYGWCETHSGQCKKIADRWYPNGPASESVLYRCDAYGKYEL